MSCIVKATNIVMQAVLSVCFLLLVWLELNGERGTLG